MAEKTEQITQKAETTEKLDIEKLKDLKIAELNKIARDLQVNGVAGLKKQDLIFKILQAQTEREGLIFGEGVR